MAAKEYPSDGISFAPDCARDASQRCSSFLLSERLLCLPFVLTHMGYEHMGNPGTGDADALPDQKGGSMRSLKGRLGTGLVSVATVASVWAVATPAHAAGATCHGVTATIVGTSGSDEIKGTPHRDVIQAKGGDDQIAGLGGDDIICGGPGIDQIMSGEGRDKVYGGPGPDSLSGALGRDRLWGNRGSDQLAGQAGKDWLFGGGGHDQGDGGGGDRKSVV